MRETTSQQRDTHGSWRTGRRTLTTIAIAAMFVLGTIAAAHGSGPGAAGPDASQRDVAQVRAAVAKYHTPERALAAGWELLPGLDGCFEFPGVGGMGVHYIDPVQLDNGTLDPRRPEALLFVPGPRGQLRLGAVEYIVPIEDPDDPGEPPSILGHEFDQLQPIPDVHVWGLHLWLFEPNPAGMFAHWNPRVSCEAMPDDD